MKHLEDLFIKYLKTDSEYIRTVPRKIFTEAVARIYVLGVKFDCVPVLDGDQGIGKSTILKDLVTPEYYWETLSLTDMDDKSGTEKLQGFWVIEIGELAGMKRRTLRRSKHGRWRAPPSVYHIELVLLILTLYTWSCYSNPLRRSRVINFPAAPHKRQYQPENKRRIFAFLILQSALHFPLFGHMV